MPCPQTNEHIIFYLFMQLNVNTHDQFIVQLIVEYAIALTPQMSPNICTYILYFTRMNFHYIFFYEFIHKSENENISWTLFT